MYSKPVNSLSDEALTSTLSKRSYASRETRQVGSDCITEPSRPAVKIIHF